MNSIRDTYSMDRSSRNSLPESELKRNGSFDEESCRFFLREVGSRVVPFYPFSFGMEEVYSLILERYGYAGIPDATSVLQELLEDNGSANGSGDDGDIWRSWRHSWRHRNDDSLNPFIPKVGSFVLQRPTSPRIRRVKAVNFLSTILQTSSDKSSPQKSSLPFSTSWTRQALSTIEKFRIQENNEKIVTLPTINLNCFPACPTTQYHKSVTSHAVVENEWEPRNAVLTVNGNDWEFSAEGRKSGNHGPALASTNTITVPSTPTKSGLVSCINSSKEQEVGLRGGDTNRYSMQTETSHFQHGPYRLIRHSHEEDVRCSLRETADNFNYVTLTRASNLTMQDSKPISPPTTPESVKKRNVHREARLIDGAIFNSKTGRNAFPEDTLVEQDTILGIARGVSCKSELIPARQNQHFRHSWINNVRQMFLSKNDNNECIPRFKQHHRPDLGIIACVRPTRKPSHRKMESTGSPIPTHGRPQNLALMLDGSCDEKKSPSKSFSNLNKALPYNPDDIVRSLSSRTQTPFLNHPQNGSYQPLTASTSSSNVSQGSSRGEFRAITKEMFERDATTQHELSPVKEYDLDLDPRKYEPQKSPWLSASTVSFSSVARQNPFSDDPIPLSPTFCPRPTEYSNPQYGSKLQQAENYPILHDENDRGRRVHQMQPPTSVVKNSNDTNHTPPKAPKRSRSPVKTFLRFGKSASMKDINNFDRATNEMISVSHKKPSLKDWGRKLRYGFLTADEEELEREAQIDQHLEDHGSPLDNAKFHVSLGTSYQAKVLADIEVMIAVSANDFLATEARGGRISVDSLAKVRKAWSLKGRPEVIEFFYDILTQRELILANAKTVRFRGSFANDMLAVNSVFRAWDVMAKELSIRTFCTPDSVIRSHLHNAHRVLELLGAPVLTFLAFEELQVAVFEALTKAQKKRIERRGGNGSHIRNLSDPSHNTFIRQRDISDSSALGRYQCYADKLQSMKSSPAPSSTIQTRKATGAGGVIMGSPNARTRDVYDNSRGGRLGTVV